MSMESIVIVSREVKEGGKENYWKKKNKVLTSEHAFSVSIW